MLNFAFLQSEYFFKRSPKNTPLRDPLMAIKITRPHSPLPNAQDLLDALRTIPKWRQDYPLHKALHFCNPGEHSPTFFYTTDVTEDHTQAMLSLAYDLNLGLGMKFHALLISEGLLDDPVH
jgi:hypothetical protein